MKYYPLIGELRHRLHACSLHDIVTENGDMRLVREDVTQVWAKIAVNIPSQFSRDGYNIGESRRAQSHVITMRMRRDLDISATAWLYEKRLQSGARWFQVLGTYDVSECGEFIALSCRLRERGDGLVKPVQAVEADTITKAAALPEGVKL